MVSTNVDELLLNEITGTKPPEKIEEAPRETSDSSNSTQTDAAKSGEQAIELSGNSGQLEAEKQKIETNEYGDKPESISENRLDKTDNPSSGDEYGLDAETSKTYTKQEMDAYANERVRERLDRIERNSGQKFTQQQIQQQVQQTQQDFNYDENSNLDWQQQLKQFVKQTNIEQQQEYARQVQQAKQEQRLEEFGTKFKNGMEKFADYREVVGKFDIKDDMLFAAEDINDPAALFYAAAKRMPEELAKISRIESEHARAAAIGRLDEKLRKQATKVSSAPKPISRTHGDMTVEVKEPREQTLDDMLLASEAKKRELLLQRRR